MDDLKNKWKLFLSIILDPWTLLLIVGVISLLVFSTDQTDKTITSLLFILITIASAILGGRMTKHWADITEGGIVIARGKSAVRSLQLLLRNITALEHRVVIFSACEEDIEKHPEVTKRNYEEIQGICNLLEEETVNSVENWTDIVPEADIKTQIGIITELKQSLDDREGDLQGLNDELSSEKGKSEGERKDLEAKAKKMEKQIARLEREITEKKVGLGGGVYPGLRELSATQLSIDKNPFLSDPNLLSAYMKMPKRPIFDDPKNE